MRDLSEGGSSLDSVRRRTYFRNCPVPCRILPLRHSLTQVCPDLREGLRNLNRLVNLEHARLIMGDGRRNTTRVDRTVHWGVSHRRCMLTPPGRASLGIRGTLQGAGHRHKLYLSGISLRAAGKGLYRHRVQDRSMARQRGEHNAYRLTPFGRARKSVLWSLPRMCATGAAPPIGLSYHRPQLPSFMPRQSSGVSTTPHQRQ